MHIKLWCINRQIQFRVGRHQNFWRKSPLAFLTKENFHYVRFLRKKKYKKILMLCNRKIKFLFNKTNSKKINKNFILISNFIYFIFFCKNIRSILSEYFWCHRHWHYRDLVPELKNDSHCRWRTDTSAAQYYYNLEKCKIFIPKKIEFRKMQSVYKIN